MIPETAYFDWIIVGAGTAGCVLAARLSERPQSRVLLLEAGDDVLPGREPEDIRSVYPASYFNKAYMWPGLKVHWRTEATSRASAFDQGRVVGGSGAVMGMVALRGTAADYDEWQSLGAAGWGWSDVLPYFRRLESDCDFPDDPLHGASGPTTIRRVMPPEWPPLARAVLERQRNAGLPLIADLNGAFGEGMGPLPMSSRQDRRSSSGLDYLADARRRKNLTVIANASVERILFDGRQATGVVARTPAGPKRFLAHEIILAAGAIQSPALLMRSGIGPGAELARLGIPLVAALAGVGANLQNHAILFIGGHLKAPARQPASLVPQSIACVRFSSGLSGAPAMDLYFNVQSKSSWSRLGGQIANLGVVLLKPESRGRVTLASPEGMPTIACNFAGTELDLARLKLGFRKLAELALDERVRRLFNVVFPVSFDDRIRRLNRRTSANAFKAGAVAAALDIAPALGRPIFARLTDTKTPLAMLIADDEALTGHVLRNVAGTFHVAGTCRMGGSNDPHAVTDASGRLYGVEGLRVVDASLMPTVPRGNTNIPTIMIAEKIADNMSRE